MDKKELGLSLSDYDKELLESFLILIRDRYREADEANYFLETSGISSINVAITNQRDAISHFVSFLKLTKEEDYNERKSQINAAEEHLRRAVIEPYQLAIDSKMIAISNYYRDFRLLANEEDDALLDEINSEIKEIHRLYKEGRSKKSENEWSESWKNGVKALAEGFELADSLVNKLEKIVVDKNNKKEKEKMSRNTALSLSSYGLLVGAILGFIVGLFF